MPWLSSRGCSPKRPAREFAFPCKRPRAREGFTVRIHCACLACRGFQAADALRSAPRGNSLFRAKDPEPVKALQCVFIAPALHAVAFKPRMLSEAPRAGI